MATNPPSSPGPHAPHTQGRIRLASLLLGLALAGSLAAYAWYQSRSPQPPAVDLEGADPLVAEAIEAARKEVVNSPRSAKSWGKLGKLLWAHEYHAAAGACFARAEQLAPRDPHWPYYQGLLALRSDLPQAIPHLQRAADLCGDEPAAVRLRLGQALREEGNLEAARDQFRRALQAEPNNAQAHLELARLAFDQDDLAECLAHLPLAADHPCTRKGAHTLLVAVYRRQGDGAAEERERRLLSTLPDDPSWPDPFNDEVQLLHTGKAARLRQAESFFSQGRLPDGIAVLRDLVQEDPDLDWAWLRLGRALVQSHQLEEAEEALRRAVQLRGDLVEAHFYLGVAAFERGHFSSAARAFRRATELKPDYGMAYFNLGECLLREGDRAGAVTAFQRALDSSPQLLDAHLRLAELLGPQSPEAARRHLHAAQQLEPTDPRVQRLLADPASAPDRGRQ